MTRGMSRRNFHQRGSAMKLNLSKAKADSSRNISAPHISSLEFAFRSIICHVRRYQNRFRSKKKTFSN